MRIDSFLISPQKTFVVGTQKCLGEALLMSPHNICFQWRLRKIFTLYSLLSGAIIGYCMMSVLTRGNGPDQAS